MEIKDRIKELRRVPASELLANPLNHRIHPEAQRKKLRQALGDIGFAGAVLAREGENGQLILIDGHMRASECGKSDIPVLILDVNELEANKILASYDAIGAMAEIDKKILDDLVNSFADDDPFKTDGINEALEPAEDIISREKQKEREKLREKIEKAEKYKKDEYKLGIQPNEWWRIKAGKYVFSGSFKHPNYLKGLEKKFILKRNTSKNDYTILLSAPQDEAEDYVMPEQILTMCNEAWTFTNNDWKNIKPLIDRGYVKGIYPFTDGKNAQLAIFESISRDEPIIPIPCGFVCESINTRRIAFSPERMPEPTNGSVVVSGPISWLVSRMRVHLESNGYVPRFVAPAVNTGRIARMLINGHYSHAFMSEENLDLCETLVANGFKYQGSMHDINDSETIPYRVTQWD